MAIEASNTIVLRPRFQKNLDKSSEEVLQLFEKTNVSKVNYSVSRVDHHVFIRIPKNKQHFWSPQLHLEIYDDHEGNPILKGLFGPSPTVWTLFMFLHFVVAILFVGAGIWLYVNMSLEKSYVFALISMGFLIIVWFVLYFAGRMGKETGKGQMEELYRFMEDTIQ